jgi:hypothetical protein
MQSIAPWTVHGGYMRFKDVDIGQAFDFEETGWLGNIKVSSRRYLYRADGEYWPAQIGEADVVVSNVRNAYQWELEQANVKVLGG